MGINFGAKMEAYMTQNQMISGYSKSEATKKPLIAVGFHLCPDLNTSLN